MKLLITKYNRNRRTLLVAMKKNLIMIAYKIYKKEIAKNKYLIFQNFKLLKKTNRNYKIIIQISLLKKDKQSNILIRNQKKNPR